MKTYVKACYTNPKIPVTFNFNHKSGYYKSL